ncbi:hypothetical protein CDL15_Pgr005987 [Punica granatum]|uniref:Uncharacterized protein n=1 Tax=Punica granatum TaxID=22663 RepID=A0A218VTA5_PUNGR|nr:hypothetical protein CDL15_Pgr005987 [Punica granatum]
MLFPINSRLPTLLLDKSILITNNSRSNFTLNHRSHLTTPDLFSTPTVSVHRVGMPSITPTSTTTKTTTRNHRTQRPCLSYQCPTGGNRTTPVQKKPCSHRCLMIRRSQRHRRPHWT